MQDRLKFRCGITIPHYDENGNDIETKIIFNTEALYDDNTVGIGYDKLKSRVDELHLNDEKLKTLWDYLYEHEVTEDWFNFHNADFIEQCTGLKDKNGRLIYEGDIVKETSFDEDSWAGREIVETSVVCFGGGEYPCSFTLKNKRFYRGYPLLNYGINRLELEVIGNIHENTELTE